MAIAVLVIVVGLIVGVTIELLLSKRQRARTNGIAFERSENETLKPSPPRLPEPRFIDDGEGFRIIGPVDYDDPGAAPWESDEPNGPEEQT